MKVLRQITSQKEKKMQNRRYPHWWVVCIIKKIVRKTIITSNDGRNNTPAKIPCFQNLTKTVSNLEMLNPVDQEHQIPQKLGDAISKTLASR